MQDNNWPIEKVAWAAGFFDGEGCISARTSYTYSTRRSKNKVMIAFLVVTVVQKDKKPLEILEQMFGGALRLNRNKTGYPIHVLELYGQKAMNMLEILLPYLIAKKSQAELALTMKNDFQPGKLLTQEQIIARQHWHTQMRQLKSVII